MRYCIKKIGAIEKWDEGIAVGNGNVGGLFYGEDKLVCALDKAGLWDNRQMPEETEKGFNYSNMVKLVKSNTEKDWKEFLRLFDDCYSHTTPTKINAGKLILDFEITSDCVFELNINNAVLKIRNGMNEITAFISANSNLGYIISDKELSYNIKFPNYFYLPYVNYGENSLDKKGHGLGYEKSYEVIKNGVNFYVQKTTENGYFAIAVKRFAYNDKRVLSYSVLVGENEREIFNTAEKIFAVNFNSDYKKHLVCWKNFWKESKINIPNKKLEKLYYLSYYLFNSGNRKGLYPMPLQGVWTKCDDELPPWKGDYHHDLNTQFTYVSYLKANHLESGRVFIDYLWDNLKNYQKFAKEFYGVNGILIPAVSTLNGKPLGGWPMYSLSPTMSIWLAQSFDDYFKANDDKEFLINKAFPFFKGVIDAMLGLMIEKEGKLYLPLSSSPEYNDCTPEAFFEWSNNDLQLVRYGLDTIIGYCATLNYESKKYIEALSKLDDFYVDKQGVLYLDNKKRYVETSHRHHSNLMCIYPLKTLTAKNGDNVMQIENNLLHLELLGTGLWVGFSFPWFSAISAMGYFGNRALNYLQIFERCFVAENGFHLNGDFKKYGVSNFHYRPFTLESNYVFCSALQEMLMQDHEGFINLFPAIPDDWKNEKIEFGKFLSAGCEISATYYKGAIRSFSIFSKVTKSIKIKNTFGKNELKFSNRQIVVCPLGEVFELKVDNKICFLLGD